MFAYCRNNPVCRKDITGTTDVALPEDGTDLLDEEKSFEGAKISNGDSAISVKRIGGGHGNPTHKERIEKHMDKLQQTGENRTIYGNRSLKTAGLIGNQRPDVIAVRCDGRVEVWEFASPSQVYGSPGYYALLKKIDIMAAANPSVEFHAIILW